jgi:hypothetical protein
MLRFIVISLVILLLPLFAGAQDTAFENFRKADYCAKDTLKLKTLIGRKVKLWSDGGVYPTLNQTNFFNGLPEEFKRKGGESGWGIYTPAAGDTGVIVQVFRKKRGFARNIYLVRVGDNYVPMGCADLTDADKPDLKEQGLKYYIRDSLRNVSYAAGCSFKMRRVNSVWSATGYDSLDRLSETYACDVAAKGIDTVLLCKHNGYSLWKKAFVLWMDKGHGYVKAFFNNSNQVPTANDVKEFDVQSLVNFFFANRIDTVKTDPDTKYSVDHAMGYHIELQVPSLFFRKRLNDDVVARDITHVKAAWWRMVSNKLDAIKNESIIKDKS